MLRFGAAAHHLLDGNNMRFQRNSQIRVDAAWREQLSAEDLAFFEQRAGALNRQLGYQS